MVELYGGLEPTPTSREQKLAQQRVYESEQRFRTMADKAPVMIWISGLDKLCTNFNKPWLDFTGRTLDRGRSSRL